MQTRTQREPAVRRPGRTAAVVALVLAAGTLAVYARSCRNGFLNYDDPLYVTDNKMVQAGLSGPGFRRAWTALDFGNWHPLVWLSLQLDWQLYGGQAWGFHLTNVLLHTAGALLLFAALRRMTGAVWPSALAAALFAVHPLNVESVAWVAERKGVLATLFGMLTLWSYAVYAERPGWGRYLGVVLALGCGLMAKPTAAVVPFVLLLLDYWPLGRLFPDRRPDAPREDSLTLRVRSTVALRVLEKIPLLALAVVVAAVDADAQANLGAALARQGRWREAVTPFRAAVRLRPAPAALLADLGQALARQAEWPEAALWLSEAVRQSPRDPVLRCRLAWILVQQGETGAAKEQFDEAFRLDPRWPQAADRQARALAGGGPGRADPWLAVQTAEAVNLATGRREPQYLDTLAAAYAAAGELPRARAAAEEALRRANRKER